MRILFRALGGLAIVALAAVVWLLHTEIKSLKKVPEQKKLDVSSDVAVLSMKLKKYGTLDKVVKHECDFAQRQNKRNIEFFQEDVEHLKKLDTLMKDVIFRYKTLTRAMTYEWGAVKEQLVLMQDENVTKPSWLQTKENREQLEQNINRINELLNEQQSIALMWDNIKTERKKQIEFCEKLEAETLKNKDYSPYGDK